MPSNLSRERFKIYLREFCRWRYYHSASSHNIRCHGVHHGPLNSRSAASIRHRCLCPPQPPPSATRRLRSPRELLSATATSSRSLSPTTGAAPCAATALSLSLPSTDGAAPSAMAASIRRGSRRPLRPPLSAAGTVIRHGCLHLPWPSPTAFIRHSHLHLHPTREPPSVMGASITRDEQEGNWPSWDIGHGKMMHVTAFQCQHFSNH